MREPPLGDRGNVSSKLVDPIFKTIEYPSEWLLFIQLLNIAKARSKQRN